VLDGHLRSRRTNAVVRSGSDNAYGIYLSQMLFITALAWLGWGRLSSTVPWPLLCLLTVAIVFACGITLTSVLARTPLAVPLTGRRQQPWSTLIPRHRAAGQIYPERASSQQALKDQDPPPGRPPRRAPRTSLTRNPPLWRVSLATRTERDSDSGMDRTDCGTPGRRAIP
jgi:hypothetical protein